MKAMCFGLVALLALSACKTTVQTEYEKSNYLTEGYKDRPLSDFMIANGATPIDMFDMPSGRVFIFDLPCRSWWYTRRVAPSKSPASFVVERVEVKGYCP